LEVVFPLNDFEVLFYILISVCL